MKRFLILALCLIIIFSGCASIQTRDWQTVNFPDCGTLKLPEEWRVYEEGGLLYIVDANDQPIMIQTHSYCGIDDGDQGDTESNAYFEDVTAMKFLSSAVLSNSAGYGEVLVSHNGTETSKLFLDLSSYTQSVIFIVWDETIDIDMLTTIAETFIHA